MNHIQNTEEALCMLVTSFILADGTIHPRELDKATQDCKQMGFSFSLKAINDQTLKDALNHIRAEVQDDTKEYILLWILQLMSSDGDVDPFESQLFLTTCNQLGVEHSKIVAQRNKFELKNIL